MLLSHVDISCMVLRPDATQFYSACT